VGTTLLVLLIGTPAAYSLARFEFKMKSKDITLWFFVPARAAASRGVDTVLHSTR